LKDQAWLVNFQLSTCAVLKELTGVFADVSWRNLLPPRSVEAYHNGAMDTGTKGVNERPHALTECSLFTICELHHVGLPHLQ
jgi:hypothetical protein